MSFNFTLVLGVDAGHVQRFRLVWPNWIKYKPSILKHPLVIFYDKRSLLYNDVKNLPAPHQNVTFVPWPTSKNDLTFQTQTKLKEIEYEGDPKSKWYHPQRYKMLAGFVHVPAVHVHTPYYLKLDLDVVMEGPDDWIDERWFEGNPAIVGQPWGFSKPPEQMMKLDHWFNIIQADIEVGWNQKNVQPPLNLIPKPGSSLVKHRRFISWCSFFNTDFTRTVSEICEHFCGEGKMPCHSQDGTVFYLCKRLGYTLRTENFKARGFHHKSTIKGIKEQIAAIEKGEG